MKTKKPDGKGRDVPTHQTKNRPKEPLKKLIRKSAINALNVFKQQAGK